MLTLSRFRVTGFRSVHDSGWIDADRVTALIGTNEAGKTNLLLPLWKFNPAKGGAINPIADYPRKRYNEIRSLKKKPTFIHAEFLLSDDLIAAVVKVTGAEPSKVQKAVVTRDFEGGYTCSFPDAGDRARVTRQEVEGALASALTEIQVMEAVAGEEGIKDKIAAAITDAQSELVNGGEGDWVFEDDVLATLETLQAAAADAPQADSSIAPRFARLVKRVAELLAAVNKPHPNTNAEARNLITANLPKFVYYSNYGNLDSEIYLPHVIQNLERTDLGTKEEAKARTLKVLFEFVKLSPQEIHKLGKDVVATPNAPTLAEIEKNAEKRKERDILLQSASTDLTGKFRDWWKQGAYRFRFQADGDHFRIWVSDDKRPEDIELEGRSSGLQWFFSFYLVFLVESADSHEDAILLLDEPGVTLHALAQRDLSLFFKSLSNTNQLLFTTHSPFMVDPDHLDRVRAVYVNEKGATAVSADLRAGPTPSSSEAKSIYPVHAALGLSLSETILMGARPVMVEGTSDQRILSAIKTVLVASGVLQPKRELLFLPGGGSKGITAAVPVVTGKDDELPFVILDSDKPGKDLQQRLASGLYVSAKERLLMVADYAGFDGAEIEDIVPPDLMADVAARYFRGPQDDFAASPGMPVVPQIEAYAKKHGLPLSSGWKVEIANLVKQRLLKGVSVDKKWMDVWSKLFAQLAV